MQNIGWGAEYFLFAAVCYYIFYATEVDFNFRLNVPFNENDGLWQKVVAHEKGVLKLLVLDFLKIHCPWSREISTEHRVQEARRLLQHMRHEKGWTMADCDNPANHEQIARDCFRSRTRFWLEGIFLFLTSPLRLVVLTVILAIAAVVLPVVSVYQWLLGLTRR